MYLVGVDTQMPVSLQSLTAQNLTPSFPDITAHGLGPSSGAGNGMRICNLEGGGWYQPTVTNSALTGIEGWVSSNPGIVLAAGLVMAVLFMTRMSKGAK